jgi:hypothetical protein
VSEILSRPILPRPFPGRKGILLGVQGSPPRISTSCLGNLRHPRIGTNFQTMGRS